MSLPFSVRHQIIVSFYFFESLVREGLNCLVQKRQGEANSGPADFTRVGTFHHCCPLFPKGGWMLFPLTDREKEPDTPGIFQQDC